MSNIGHRHVVRELERAIPALLAIHRPRAKAIALEVPRVPIYVSRPTVEFRSTFKQVPVVIQVVQIDFKSSSQDAHPKLASALPAVLRDELEGGFDTE